MAALLKFSWITTLVVFGIAGLTACKKPSPEDSELSIVGGEIVSEDSLGPERLSTVGLDGCTGVIIGPDLILTAAHCFSRALNGGYAVFGTSFNSSLRHIIQINGGIRNPSYQGPGTDVAVLRLAQEIPEGYQAVALYRPGNPIFRGDRVRLAGYGTDNTANSFGILRAVDSVIQSRANDNSLYVENGRTAACTGDSGGPLYLQRNGEWFTAGVASTAYMDQSRRCVGGNHFAPVQENFDIITSMARELTGRENPFQTIPPVSSPDSSNEGNEGEEADRSEPVLDQSASFQIDPNGFTENRRSLALNVTSTSPVVQTSCTFEVEITRGNGVFPTRYKLTAEVESVNPGEEINLEFSDYMFRYRMVLGSIREISDPSYNCEMGS